jgi:hypothetical protein
MAFNESSHETILRRAREWVESCRDEVTRASIALHAANESLKKAKEKFDAAFAENEKQEIAKRRSQYSHSTK